jgi:hypothetical protein
MQEFAKATIIMTVNTARQLPIKKLTDLAAITKGYISLNL